MTTTASTAAATAAHREFLGASIRPDGCSHFVVWAPRAERLDLHLLSPRHEIVPMQGDSRGYFRVTVENVAAKARYRFRLDGDAAKEFPDPVSRSQPDGVHGPSEVVPRDFPWSDTAWRNHPLRDFVIYELHVGTFTTGGTFADATAHLARLRELGITAIELMPVAQFPGTRNWGYDGVFPFAVQDSYGGAEGLKNFVEACHRADLAVVLDVVYNHLGPEGNYVPRFAPYFTDVYHTPWGEAVNFDDAHCDEVRRYFIENALQWIEEFHIDALRLDAVHAIMDRSAYPFLEELAATIHRRAEALGRRVYVIAESDLNDPRLVRTPSLGGFGLDGMWVDDLHHALHALLTGERSGYYADFGTMDHLAKAWNTGASIAGSFSPYRRRKHGRPFEGVQPEQIVVASQNHDQVGNRLLGDRLTTLVSFEKLKLAAGVVLMSPFVPLLFMGEEYGETAPFQYFISHGDTELIDAVRTGRKAEFEAFDWKAEPPDPQAEATFRQCVIDHDLRHERPYRTIYAVYAELLRARQRCRDFAHHAVAFEHPQVVFVRADDADACPRTCMAFHFSDTTHRVMLPVPPGEWRTVFDSSAPTWDGPGRQVPETLTSAGSFDFTFLPHSFIIIEQI